MTQSQRMRKALKERVIPQLLLQGFVGEYPHYRRTYDDRIELLAFLTSKYGNAFTVEISTVFLPSSKRDNNLASGTWKEILEATVWDANIRYRLKGMFDGWFYYSDVYRQKLLSGAFYNAVSETRAKTYVPLKREKLVQKADENTCYAICNVVNKQMRKAYRWWDAFHKGQRIRMFFLSPYKFRLFLQWITPRW